MSKSDAEKAIGGAKVSPDLTFRQWLIGMMAASLVSRSDEVKKDFLQNAITQSDKIIELMAKEK